MQFFNFDAVISSSENTGSADFLTSGLDSLLKANGFNREMKLELFTMGRNSILIRVENIGDIFNSEGEVIYQQVNIKELA